MVPNQVSPLQTIHCHSTIDKLVATTEVTRCDVPVLFITDTNIDRIMRRKGAPRPDSVASRDCVTDDASRGRESGAVEGKGGGEREGGGEEVEGGERAPGTGWEKSASRTGFFTRSRFSDSLDWMIRAIDMAFPFPNRFGQGA